MADTSVLPQPDSSTFRIAIREMTPSLVSEPGKVWERVGSIFTEFCGRNTGNRFNSAQAYWVDKKLAANTLAPHELIVYLVSGKSASLIRKHYPAAFTQAAPNDNTLGLTYPGSKGTISEVYAGHSFFSGEPVLLANLIIHELMHNKLGLGDAMHDRASGAGGVGGFLQGMFANLSMVEKMAGSKLYATPADKDAMIPVLGKSVNQFQDA